MKLPLLSAATLAAIVVAPAIARDAEDVAACQRIASALEAQRGALSSNPDLRPLSVVSQGTRPIIEMAAAPDELRAVDEKLLREWQQQSVPLVSAVGINDYEQSFGTKYKPNPQLAAAVAHEIPYQYVAVESLPNDPLHALTARSGSADCVQFVFFEAIPGQESHLATDPPPSMDGALRPDIGPHRFECYVSDGHLAKIDGQSAFVVADYVPTAFGSDLRVAKFGNGAWSRGCRTTLDFETVFKTTKATAETDSRLSAAALARLAPTLALALDRAQDAKSAFAFGPPIPSALAEQARWAEAEAEISAVGGLPHRPAHPIFLQGRLYLVMAAHPEYGRRDQPGYVIDLYAIDGQSLKHAGHTELTASRGMLLSVRADALPDS